MWHGCLKLLPSSFQFSACCLIMQQSHKPSLCGHHGGPPAVGPPTCAPLTGSSQRWGSAGSPARNPHPGWQQSCRPAKGLATFCLRKTGLGIGAAAARGRRWGGEGGEQAPAVSIHPRWPEMLARRGHWDQIQVTLVVKRGWRRGPDRNGAQATFGSSPDPQACLPLSVQAAGIGLRTRGHPPALLLRGAATRLQYAPGQRQTT